MSNDLFETLVLEGLVDAVPEIAEEIIDSKSSGDLLSYEDFPYQDLLVYGGIDCIATSTILSELFPKICEEPEFYIVGPSGSKITTKAPAIIKSVSEVEMVAHEYLLDLEINGIKYDVDRNREFGIMMVQEVSELEDSIFKTTGKFNWSSGVEMQSLLYEKMGFEPPSLTKSGEPSTDGDALLTLAGIDPMSFKYIAEDPDKQWLADLAKMKDINSTYNTFVKTYVEDFVKRDGRIHPSYNQYGTSSHRISSSQPNTTQLPRAKHGYNLRECYIVDEGYLFLALDWSGAEVKCLGAISGDKALLRAIELKYDFHAFSASQILGVPYGEFIEILADKKNPLNKSYKMTRQSAKALTFGINWGTITQ